MPIILRQLRTFLRRVSLHVPPLLLELHIHHADTRDAVCFLEEQLEVGLTLVTYRGHLRVTLIVAVTVLFEF